MIGCGQEPLPLQGPGDPRAFCFQAIRSGAGEGRFATKSISTSAPRARPLTPTQVRAGRLRAIAMASLKRTTVAPDVPTLAESGLPGFEAGVWYGIMGPAGLSPEIVTRLHQELARIVRLPEVRERLAVEGVEPVGNTPAEFAVYLKTEMAKYAGIARKAQIRPE